MINLDQVSFIIIIQTIIFLIMLSVFLLFLLRSKNKQLKKLKHIANDDKDESSTSSVEHYLTAEIKLTQSRFDLLYKDENFQGGVLSEPDWLRLRKNFLDMEKEILSSTDREDAFWVDLGKKLKKLLSISLLVKRIKVKDIDEDDEDEVKEMKALLKSQHEDFDDLLLKLEGEKNAAEIAELNEKLSVIMRSHTELSQCLYMLEDENKFLRDQINSLLK